QPVKGLPISTVYADAYTGFMELTKYIINLGHRNIAFLRSFKKYSVADCRFQAYVDVLKESNIDIDKNLIEECDFTAISAYEATEKLLSRSKPSAIICVSDLVAIGALKFVLEKGIRVPEDIAITGYDNISLSALMTPGLTTVQEPIKKMARNAVNILVRKINNKKEKNENTVLGVKLLIRESTEIKRTINS
ncbi:MAG: substrate-binding domain-containing protein, partial [Actinobacteria bacterium]|nr:substrate-binding domain-containing protein [Actinomycetota bacterium]